MMASTTEDHMMECSDEDDHASSGQADTLSKLPAQVNGGGEGGGDEEDKSSFEGVSGQGATNSDELEPPMDTQQVHRESDEPINGSDQVPAKASVEVLLHRSHLHHVSPNGNRSNRMNPQGPSRQGATNSDELEKKSPDPPMAAQQVHPDSGGPVPGSDHYPVQASVKRLMPSEVLHELQSDDHASSGQSPPVRQGVSGQGATSSDELDPPKGELILDTPMDAPQVHPGSGGPVPGSDHYPVQASDKELTSSEVLPKLQRAADFLLKYKHLRNKNPKINKVYNNLEKGLKDTGSHKTPSSHAAAGTVKIHTIVTGETFGADTALLDQVSCKKLQVEMTDRQGCDIIILFCPINSRVGSDVELAMTQVSDKERVILILMHHTRDVDYSTAAKRWSETFQNVVFDVNVLYHETVPGLLKCPKNTEAIKAIRKELAPYSHSGSTEKTWKESLVSLFWGSSSKNK